MPASVDIIEGWLRDCAIEAFRGNQPLGLAVKGEDADTPRKHPASAIMACRSGGRPSVMFEK